MHNYNYINIDSYISIFAFVVVVYIAPAHVRNTQKPDT